MLHWKQTNLAAASGALRVQGMSDKCENVIMFNIAAQSH